MATIEKRDGKNGVSYRITVSGGFDHTGKRVRHRMTYTPAPGMTARQMEKAAQRAASDFERSIEQGYALDNRQTFAEYADYCLDLKERAGIKPRTLDRYKELLTRTNAAIGHIKLVDLRPQHLNQFYKNLAEPGIRADARAQAKIDFPAWLKLHKTSRAKLAEEAGISETTVCTAAKGEPISTAKASQIANAMGLPVGEVFTPVQNTAPLADKTILEYHRLICTILHQAEREMLVPYNAAEKAVPPKVERHDPNYFQPETISAILGALEQEPLKWRAITHLLIVTGCRRGEVMGLQWSKIDFENQTVRIDSALISSKSKGVYLGPTKTRDCRTLKLPQETIELLRQQRVEQLRQQLAYGSEWINSGFVFTTDRGAHMNPDSITGWLRDFSKRHNLPSINPHAFRHTVASVLLANGTDIVTVSKQLGHASVTTTEGYYAHIIAENQAKASECIADVLLRKKA